MDVLQRHPISQKQLDYSWVAHNKTSSAQKEVGEIVREN